MEMVKTARKHFDNDNTRRLNVPTKETDRVTVVKKNLQARASAYSVELDDVATMVEVLLRQTYASASA